MTTLTKTNAMRMEHQQGRPAGISSSPVRISFKMNGLRMYIKPLGPQTTGEPGVFYSRRGDGPYYLWQYEEKVGLWRGSRVTSTDFAPRELLMASWKIVP